MSDNQVQNVDPESVRRMERLATLDLQNNDIMQVPPQLGLCTQIRWVNCRGFPNKASQHRLGWYISNAYTTVSLYPNEVGK